jgi:hypothetical protein
VHAVGAVLLFVVALPGLTAPKMAATAASVGLLPALFKACSDRRASGKEYTVVRIKAPLLAQAASIGTE